MLHRLPFILHALIELPAVFVFGFAPEKQLPGLSAPARLILQSYSGALASTVWIGLIFAARQEIDRTTHLIALALATYHILPIRRAIHSIRNNTVKTVPKVLGGPAMHLCVHCVCLAALLGSGLIGIATT